MNNHKATIIRGTLTGTNFECPVTVMAEYEEHGTNPVKCHILPDMAYFSANRDNFSGYKGHFSLSGKTEKGDDVFISKIEITSAEFYLGHGFTFENPKQIAWRTDAATFIMGQLGSFDSSEGEIICHLFTSPSPLAHSGVDYMRSYDGTIQIENKVERQGIKWGTPFGEAEYTDEFRYLTEERVGIDPAVIQIKRSCIVLRVTNRNRLALDELLIEIQDYFDNVCWLMSFLSRRRVIWYEGEAIFLATDENSFHRQAFVRRNKWHGYVDITISHHPVINFKLLRDGLFQHILNGYESSENRELIKRTIVHLLLSYERVYFENQYTSVYTGLEGLVSSSSMSSQIVEAGKFKKIRTKIEQFLQEELENTALIQEMGKKISGLQHRSFTDQLQLHLKQNKIDLSVLWPDSDNPFKELKELIQRRNRYMHNGQMTHMQDYDKDITKLQQLLELWILKLLGYSKDDVAPDDKL
ncbi:MAG: hypothetical protein R3C14_14625 [Caldilineaceae bacterium]